MKDNKTRGYIGRIKPGGTQDVTAPVGGSGGRKGVTRHTGSDLRGGGSKQSGK